METRFGIKGTFCDDIFFTESPISGVSPIKHLNVEISRQNSNLSEVKQRLARDAKSIGATSIMNFRYGQKKHSWWQLVLLKWDTESWYGEGDAIKN